MVTEDILLSPEGQRNPHATFGPMNDSIWKNMLECLFEYVFFTQARILYFYGSVSAEIENRSGVDGRKRQASKRLGCLLDLGEDKAMAFKALVGE